MCYLSRPGVSKHFSVKGQTVDSYLFVVKSPPLTHPNTPFFRTTLKMEKPLLAPGLYKNRPDLAYKTGLLTTQPVPVSLHVLIRCLLNSKSKVSQRQA